MNSSSAPGSPTSLRICPATAPMSVPRSSVVCWKIRVAAMRRGSRQRPISSTASRDLPTLGGPMIASRRGFSVWEPSAPRSM